MINIDNARSYSDETRLWRALENLGFHKLKPIVVCNRKGRFTAIFSLAHIELANKRCELIPMIAVIQKGFPVIN